MMKVQKTLVGLVVILIILWLVLTSTFPGPYTGFGHALILSLFSVVQLFILSIVCTLGISLIIWIPLGFGVGYIVFAIFGWGNKDKEEKSESVASSQPRDRQALINYIKKAKAKGLSDAQITQNLTNNGWATDTIAAAFQMVGNG